MRHTSIVDKDLTAERLLCAGMQVFAAKGYDGASTREICAVAGIGNASIHYHFGDKAAIYRALFARLLEEFEQRLREAHVEALAGRDALHAYYRTMLEPWADDAALEQKFHLYLREEFQSTGIVDDLLPGALRLQIEVLGELLCRELKLKKLDLAAQRLTITLQGMALGYVVPHRSLKAVFPDLTKSAHWLEKMSSYFADAGWELVKAEQRRRSVPRGSE
jgi:TetR/AcrR family transcriptional regulator, regulator of cefoperazone and chloramphenicol sensitivity